MSIHTLRVDQVTLRTHEIASVLAEMARREADAVSPQAFNERAYARAEAFVAVACELAIGDGRVPLLSPRPQPVPCRPELLEPWVACLTDDQESALNVLERLAEGGRFIPGDDARMGRALRHWADQGMAAEDEDGWFLTPAGRTHAEQVLG